MTKAPSFPFYPGDWLKDFELSVCSIFARGLLIDMLCIMWGAKERGRLVKADGAAAWTLDEIADSIRGGNREEKVAGIKELLSGGALSQDTNGVVFSRRLSRYGDVSSKRRIAGSKGGSISQAKRQANQQQDGEQSGEQTIKQKHKQNQAPSFSPSGDVPYPTVPIQGDDDDFKARVLELVRTAKSQLPPIQSGDDKRLLWKVCSAATRGAIGMTELNAAIDASRNAKEKDKPWAYVTGCFRNAIGKKRLLQVMRLEPPPPSSKDSGSADPGPVALV